MRKVVECKCCGINFESWSDEIKNFKFNILKL
jgi:hypothetical protein